MLLAGDGRAVAPRALSKLRNGERGGQRGGYVHRQLLSMGAPAWETGESGEAYVQRLLAAGLFRAVRHPGNHAYLWPLGGRRQRVQVARRFPSSLPYPKKRTAA